MTKDEMTKNQLTLLETAQSGGVNIVTCGMCGDVLLHATHSTTVRGICTNFLTGNISD